MPLPDGRELHRLLRDGLTETMAQSGWVVDLAEDTEPGGWMVGAFRVPIGEEFAAAVQFELSTPSRYSHLPLEVTGVVGVSYERAYRLWPVVWDGEQYELAVELADLVDATPPLTAKVSTPSDVRRAVTLLARPVLAHAVEWAGRYATVDAVLDACQHDPIFADRQRMVVPVVLAAAGRHDEARSALASYFAVQDPRTEGREYRRFAYQLNRWLDSGAELPPPPRGPVGEPLPFDPEAPPRKTREQREAERDAFRQAVDAVRHDGGHKTRDELRAMLQGEFTSREVVLDDPLELEMALDAVEAGDSRSARRRLGFDLLKTVVGGIVQAVRSREAPPIPTWLEPPPHAAHRVWLDPRRWVTITPDPGVEPFLQRVFDAIPTRILDSVHVDAWLQQDPEPGAAGSRIGVQIGTHRVGTIKGTDQARYEPTMELAARRAEQPLVEARITRLRDGGWLLALGTPALPHHTPPATE